MFMPVIAGRWSEKADSISSITPASDKSYCHIRHRAADELHHVDVTHDPRIAELVKSLVLTESLPRWIDAEESSRAHEMQIMR